MLFSCPFTLQLSWMYFMLSCEPMSISGKTQWVSQRGALLNPLPSYGIWYSLHIQYTTSTHPVALFCSTWFTQTAAHITLASFLGVYFMCMCMCISCQLVEKHSGFLSVPPSSNLNPSCCFISLNLVYSDRCPYCSCLLLQHTAY